MRKIFFVLFACVALIAFSIQNVYSCDCEPPPPCQPLECRVTGGGVNVNGDWDGTMAWGKFKKGNSEGWDRYTFGGQAGAPTASQPQPYGEWTHHNQSGASGSFVFHAGTASAPPGTEIDLVVCSDPGGCSPSGDPPSPCKQIDFEGVGTFKNIKDSPLEDLYVVAGETFHWFEVHIEDLGEPGKNGRQNSPGWCPAGGAAGGFADCGCADFYRITIYETDDPASAVIYEVYGYINGGNLQIHHPIH
jgi:hypothetical protein